MDDDFSSDYGLGAYEPDFACYIDPPTTTSSQPANTDGHTTHQPTHLVAPYPLIFSSGNVEMDGGAEEDFLVGDLDPTQLTYSPDAQDTQDALHAPHDAAEALHDAADAPKEEVESKVIAKVDLSTYFEAYADEFNDQPSPSSVFLSPSRSEFFWPPSTQRQAVSSRYSPPPTPPPSPPPLSPYAESPSSPQLFFPIESTTTPPTLSQQPTTFTPPPPPPPTAPQFPNRRANKPTPTTPSRAPTLSHPVAQPSLTPPDQLIVTDDMDVDAVVPPTTYSYPHSAYPPTAYPTIFSYPQYHYSQNYAFPYPAYPPPYYRPRPPYAVNPYQPYPPVPFDPSTVYPSETSAPESHPETTNEIQTTTESTSDESTHVTFSPVKRPAPTLTSSPAKRQVTSGTGPKPPPPLPPGKLIAKPAGAKLTSKSGAKLTAKMPAKPLAKSGAKPQAKLTAKPAPVESRPQPASTSTPPAQGNPTIPTRPKLIVKLTKPAAKPVPKLAAAPTIKPKLPAREVPPIPTTSSNPTSASSPAGKYSNGFTVCFQKKKK